MNWLQKMLGKDRMGDRTPVIFERHLTRDFNVAPLSDHAPQLDQVIELGHRLQVHLPAQFIAHLLGRFPGVHVEAKESVWPRPGLFDIVEAGAGQYGFHTYGAAADTPAEVNLEQVALAFRSETKLPLVPVLRRLGDADMYCLDASGQLVWFDHETRNLLPISLDFFGLLEQETSALVERLAWVRRP